MTIPEDLATAVDHLKRGLTVVFPTETVYGLGADAMNPKGVERVFALKGRPRNRPLIVHIEGVARLEEWVREIPEEARRLAERFWPGPLTLVLPGRREVPREVTGGRETVAVRVPDHPVATALLKAFGGGIAAPSANRFGRLSPTASWHVRESFGDEAGPILEGGPCPVGVESTIVGFVGERPALLRPGSISAQRIEAFLGIRMLRSGADEEGSSSPGLPGSGESHYAPATPLEVRSPDALWIRVRSLVLRGETVGVLTFSDGRELDGQGGVTALPISKRPSEYARELYAALHSLDRGGFGRILVEAPPDGEEWGAVNDRLKRASHPPGGR